MLENVTNGNLLFCFGVAIFAVSRSNVCHHATSILEAGLLHRGCDNARARSPKERLFFTHFFFYSVRA